jgi:hypothetical protein
VSKYVPKADQHDTNYFNAYNSAMALEAVLKACGDDISTENILKQVYAIKDLELPMLPGHQDRYLIDRSRAGRPDAGQRQDAGSGLASCRGIFLVRLKCSIDTLPRITPHVGVTVR